MLPLKFGAVEFVAGDQTSAESATGLIVDFHPRGPSWTDEKLKDEEEGLKRARQEMTAIFQRQAIASVRVFATDPVAARRLGLERVRRTIDILTFFAGFFTPLKRRFRAFVAPEGERVDLHWLLSSTGSHGGHWGRSNRKEAPIGGIDIRSDRAKEIGLTRVDEILGRSAPSDFETRLLTSLSWAGRAHSEHRRDQTFMLLAVALEALLTKPTARGGVTERLCRRVACILGTSADAKEEIFGDVQSLYRIRSILVHTGESSGVTDEDLDTVQDIVDRTLTVVLTGDAFGKMGTSDEFEQWLDRQSLR